jgi:alpha-galactosidase
VNDSPVRSGAVVPPMGWNSWDCFGTSVTEDEVMRNAEFMAKHLLPFGWNTVVVDIQWYEPTARAGGYNENAPVELDDFGRPLPATNRFPSAEGGVGFAPLAARVHALGLKFGLHIMRGIPRKAVDRGLPILGTDFTAADVADRDSQCDWNTDNFGLDHSKPGAQEYYDSLLKRFEEWGVDYVKVDDMVGPFHGDEIAAFSAAARKLDRQIIVSLSPGRFLSTEHAEQLRQHSDLWRISADLWDDWSDILGQFDRLAMWTPYVGDGRWADADMLPLGRIGIRAENGPDRMSRLTLDEARTMMTLWVMARSPLMFGGDLPSTDAPTMTLLTNSAVLDILGSSAGNHEVMRNDGLAVWVADSTKSTKRFVAVFSIGDEPLQLDLPLSSVGASEDSRLTELWTGVERERAHAIVEAIPAHACLLYAVEPPRAYDSENANLPVA